MNISNISSNASSFFWNFCVGSINKTPSGTNLGNVGGVMRMPVFIDYVYSNGNYYGFSTGYSPGELIRLHFGNSLLNTPTAVNLGNFGGVIPNFTECIQVVQNEGKWYAIIVAGNTRNGVTPRIIKVDFGPDITNNAPVLTNWGNLGNMEQPIDLHVFQENDNWYGFTVNAENNTITRFNFTNSFNNTPTAVNLGNIGNLAYPTGIYAINDNNFWRVFIVNGGNNSRNSGTWSLSRLDFGSSLLNVPTGVNLGNPGGFLKHPRDLTLMKFCGEIVGFAVNGAFGSSDIVKLDFRNGIASAPVITSLGNIGNLSFPHSIAKIFRVGADLYSFITNVDNNTLTRIRFSGCNNLSLPNSTLQNPPPVTYTVPGTYNVNLTIDDGLPTQSSVCKQVVVLPELQHKPIQNISVCKNTSVKIGSSSKLGSYLWNTGSTSDSITVDADGIYWVETKRFGCSNRDSFLVTITPAFTVNLGIDKKICAGKELVLDAGITGDAYAWNTGSNSKSIRVNSPGSYIITVTKNSCVAKDTVLVETHAKPAIVVSSDITICRNATTQLTASGGSSYSWTPAATLSDSRIANPMASPMANTKYYVTITDVNACEYNDSVIVNLRPDAVFAVNTPEPVCRLDSTQLVASGGDIYSWQPATGISNTSVPNPKVSAGATMDYTVTITELTCNQSKTLSTRLTVMPLPVLNAASSNDIDCRSDRSQLNAGGAAQYVWTPATTLNNPQISNPVATPATTTTYIVTGTTVNGCSAKDTVHVVVYPKPAIVVSDDTTICKNAGAQLVVSGGSSYRWAPAATLSDHQVSNPVASPSTDTRYYVSVTDNISCVYMDSVDVSVRPDPVFSISGPANVCKGDTLELNASGGDIYLWHSSGELSNPAIPDPLAFPASTKDYTVTISESVCNQSATLSARVTVLPAPIVNASKSNDIDCSNDRSQLSATGAMEYVWAPAINLTSPLIANPVAKPTSTTEYIVKGTKDGCSSYDTITIKVENLNKSGYLMPNAFTPDNDGLNDCYGVKYWGVVSEFEFSIYNRWGERIFFTKDPAKCWDGRCKGVPQDGGVYVYMIRAKTSCEPEVSRKGTFVLVR